MTCVLSLKVTYRLPIAYTHLEQLSTLVGNLCLRTVYIGSAQQFVVVV